MQVTQTHRSSLTHNGDGERSTTIIPIDNIKLLIIKKRNDKIYKRVLNLSQISRAILLAILEKYIVIWGREIEIKTKQLIYIKSNLD